MFNTKKTVRQDIHENEAAYSGTVTTVTHKTIVVFIPSLMTTSLMTIWMMKKQRSMTGTTSLLQMILAIGTLTELLRLALSNSRSVV